MQYDLIWYDMMLNITISYIIMYLLYNTVQGNSILCNVMSWKAMECNAQYTCISIHTYDDDWLYIHVSAT